MKDRALTLNPKLGYCADITTDIDENRIESRRISMSGASLQLVPDLKAPENCTDPGIGRYVQIFLTAEKDMVPETADSFVKHLENCEACLETVVRWHYEKDKNDRQADATSAPESNWEWQAGDSRPEDILQVTGKDLIDFSKLMIKRTTNTVH